jgi:hypothetical protein
VQNPSEPPRQTPHGAKFACLSAWKFLPSQPVSRSTISLMICDTNPPEADQSESGVSDPKTTLFGEALFQKIRGCFNHVFSDHD